MNLKDLVKIGYPTSSDNRNEGRYSIPAFPAGLRLCLDEIADTQRNMSLSKVERIAYCHGLSIATHAEG